MKTFLIILTLILETMTLMAQVPTVANLSATGSGIKWYTTPSGGTSLDPSTPLVNAQHYWASQTINGIESPARLDVTANILSVAAPAPASHTPSANQIVWNWNTVSGATGYKWSTSNVYSGATDMGLAVTKTETSLSCNTAQVSYVWAYNASGCISDATTLSQSTSVCNWTGGLTSYRGNNYSTYDFVVTGTTTGSVWGCSNLYTDDSVLEATAVHAGYVNNGQTKTVRVRILPGQSSYTGCTQYGVTSSSYASWGGSYEIIASW
jgi:hypothetical protein